MNNNAQAPIRTGLLDFLKNSSGCQFIIPVYQRNYTWDANKEVKQYLDDLKNVLNKEDSNHFLGILIYLDTPLDFATREFSVIDGQQRLTTTFLILYAIKALMQEKGKIDSINQLEGQFLTNPYASNDRVKYKLKPSVSDDDVYRYIVNNKVDLIENKQSRIYKNYKYILSYIKELNGNYSFNEILMALNKLYVVCIPLSIEDNAQKIFESINSTGVKLTASDLIRNFLLMDLESDLQEKLYKIYWMELEKYLTDDAKKLESFFRIFLATKNMNLPNKSVVYKEFIKWYKQNKNEYSREGIFKEIVKYARYYYQIYYQDLKDINNDLPKVVKEALSEFRKILSDMPAPLIIGLFDLYYEEKIIAEQLSELIYTINNYLIRRAICDLDTSSITKMFPPLLKNIMKESKGNYNNIVEVLKKNLVYKNINNSMYVPDNTQLEELVLNANVYKIRVTLRVIFDKIENYGNTLPLDPDLLSIEHIMPQTPTKEWYERLQVTEEEYQRNVNRLGNLTLVSKIDNSKMQNGLWENKKNIMEETGGLKMNKAILEKEEWNIHEIDKRTKQLINEIKRLFPYPETSEEMIEILEIYTEDNGINARANFYVDTGDVEILEGSELVRFDDDYEKYIDIQKTRQELLDEGIIYDDGQKIIFKKSYMVIAKREGKTALSTAASIIYQGSRNGWYVWKTKDGERLNNNEEHI